MIKKAMIPAAGFGKRIHPLTLDCPKPLLPIGNSTLLFNTIKFLEKLDIKEVVINVHYLGEQIIQYINSKKFNLKINIIKESNKILGTGGGVLNVIQNFSNEPFIIINPDTLWSSHYLLEAKLLKDIFFSNKNCKCALLVVDKTKSFDKKFKGDFNLKMNLINKKNEEDLKYIYTGFQIIDPETFLGVGKKVFPINIIWDNLIKKMALLGVKSSNNFFHVSTIDIYNSLLKNKLNIK
jgi:MurNAc alpha-1-phosphate uridylyltransferase